MKSRDDGFCALLDAEETGLKGVDLSANLSCDSDDVGRGVGVRRVSGRRGRDEGVLRGFEDVEADDEDGGVGVGEANGAGNGEGGERSGEGGELVSYSISYFGGWRCKEQGLRVCRKKMGGYTLL